MFIHKVTEITYEPSYRLRGGTMTSGLSFKMANGTEVTLNFFFDTLADATVFDERVLDQGINTRDTVTGNIAESYHGVEIKAVDNSSDALRLKWTAREGYLFDLTAFYE